MMYKIVLILGILTKLSAKKRGSYAVVCYHSEGQITRPFDENERRLPVGKEGVTNYNASAHDISFFGTPTCIYVFGITVSNEILFQQDIVSTFRLPFACFEQYENTNCFNIDGSLFPDPVTNQSSKLAHGFMCCCSDQGCNSINNPIILKQFESYWTPSKTLYYAAAPVFRYFACLFIFMVITGILASCDAVMCMIVSTSRNAWNKRVDDFESPVAMNYADMDVRRPLLEKTAKTVNSTQKSEVTETQAQSSAATQSANKCSEPSQNPSSEVPHHKRDEESTQYDELVPVPETPEQRVLPTGRLQKVSMNYEESTFSDLENP